MKTYRIVIEFTTSHSNPEKWDWHDLFGVELEEVLTVEDVQVIPTPSYHQEILREQLELIEGSNPP
jgi:hypothetical protein